MRGCREAIVLFESIDFHFVRNQLLGVQISNPLFPLFKAVLKTKFPIELESLGY